MKKYIMVFGLALVTGFGVFALTDSMAGTDLLASIVAPEMECGTDCDCSGDKMCGETNCECSKNGAQQDSCTGGCSGGSTCDVMNESACAMKSKSDMNTETTESKSVGCGCSKNKHS